MLEIKHVLALATFAVVSLAQLAIADIYQLAMSKDDAVCKHMLGLFNFDQQKYGELKYAKHPEFQAIKWNNPRELNDSDLVAEVDIDNDGTREIVIRNTAFLRSHNTDTLYVFDKGIAGHPEQGLSHDIVEKARGKVGGFKGNYYSLKEITARSVEGPEKYYYNVSGTFAVRPFVFQSAVYISMTNPILEPGGLEKVFLVILQYRPDNTLNDVCYFEKTHKRSKASTTKPSIK